MVQLVETTRMAKKIKNLKVRFAGLLCFVLLYLLCSCKIEHFLFSVDLVVDNVAAYGNKSERSIDPFLSNLDDDDAFEVFKSIATNNKVHKI